MNSRWLYILMVPLLGASVPTAAAGDTKPQAASIAASPTIAPASLRAVEFSAYSFDLHVCAGSATCTFHGTNDPKHPQLWDLDVPGLTADQQILFVTFQAPRPLEFARFAVLDVFRLDEHHVRLSVAAPSGVNASTILSLRVLVATSRDIISELEAVRTSVPRHITFNETTITPWSYVNQFAKCPGGYVMTEVGEGAQVLNGEIRAVCIRIGLGN